MTLNIHNKVWLLLVWGLDSVSIWSHSSSTSLTSCVTLNKLVIYFVPKFSGMIVIIIMSTSLRVPSACPSISAGIPPTWLTAFPLYHIHFTFHASQLPNWVIGPICWDMACFNSGLVEICNVKVFSVTFMSLLYLPDYTTHFN